MEEIDLSSCCQGCGACCGYSQNWPRFSIESEEALALIPEALVNARQSGMRCEGDRCSALQGEIGKATACGIYAVRPDVCRTCMPGDAECAMARRKFRLPAIEAAYAGTASLISSSISSSSGASTESGLVDSVIGLRPPDRDGDDLVEPSRDSA